MGHEKQALSVLHGSPRSVSVAPQLRFVGDIA
jgi:hypothetical protein